MLWHIINRVKHAKTIEKIVIATVNNKNKAILDIASDTGVNIFVGSENNVLDRYYQAAKQYNADIIVRITGDCPLIDPQIIDKTTKYFLKHNYDYVSAGHIIDKENTGSNYPDGLDTEVFSFKALEKTWKEARLPSESEHVTSYIWGHPELFKIKEIKKMGKDLSHLRWTVDESKDLKFIREVYSRLYKKNNVFYTKDILELLKEHPQLSAINSHIKKNEGYYKSLRRD